MTVTRRSLLAGVSTASLAGCLGSGALSSGGPEELTVGVTTSVDDAGLLEALHPPFEADTGATVRAVTGGTGETLAAGERGDVDAVMAHARPLEEAFLAAGHGLERRVFARGDFCVAGPADDPAGIGAAESATAAFERIADSGDQFLSRGDNSGTHVRERALWEDASVDPTGSWYQETGQGMGETLVQSSQRGAYLLSVHANVLATADQVELEAFVVGPNACGDPALDNPYSVIVVDPARHDGVNDDLARTYADYLTGSPGQERIAAFEIAGQPAFYPTDEANTDGSDEANTDGSDEANTDGTGPGDARAAIRPDTAVRTRESTEGMP